MEGGMLNRNIILFKNFKERPGLMADLLAVDAEYAYLNTLSTIHEMVRLC